MWSASDNPYHQHSTNRGYSYRRGIPTDISFVVSVVFTQVAGSLLGLGTCSCSCNKISSLVW